MGSPPKKSARSDSKRTPWRRPQIQSAGSLEPKPPSPGPVGAERKKVRVSVRALSAISWLSSTSGVFTSSKKTDS